ncbi:MAG: Gfo/Idh/MocA family oxidoreductase [Capsulimonadales bacterium]|nr:Gfo/Idh/MocA family oxidoreductase [Capsulimonadales bacterium]
MASSDDLTIRSIPSETADSADGLSRRDLLRRGAVLTLGAMFTGNENLHAEELTPETPVAQTAKPPVNVAVIGCGDQGRTLLTSLSYVEGATVSYVCDSYAATHKRALEIHPKATAVEDYRKVLADNAVRGVFIATPSHLHKQIVLDALAAGKHVYCEAPLAHTVEEARDIARAGMAAAPKTIFHSGLQYRTNPQHHHVLKFIDVGALSKVAQAKAVWHKKTSWRRKAPTDDRQTALNWRLNKATSPGLLGEIGIHQIDTATWFLKSLPKSVAGFGGVVAWKDGREVPDTVQCLFEYPNGVHLSYDATLANSFDGTYELFQGTDAAVLLRGMRAWMFKEADAPALGWEVYAYKEKIGDDTGIALVADATKLLAAGKEPAKNRDTDPKRNPIYFACEAFLNEIREGKASESGPKEGFIATVVALKANEAVLTGSKINFTPDLFDI